MEHSKNPINNNLNNNHQAENSASTSSTNPAISEKKKHAKKLEFERKFTEILERRIQKEIDMNTYQKLTKELEKKFEGFLTQMEFMDIESDLEYERDYYYSEDSENEFTGDYFQTRLWQSAQNLVEIAKNEAELAERKRVLDRKKEDLNKWEDQLEVAIKNKAVYTTGENSKAVIKAEISQELTAIKENFENIKISETAEARINYKVNKEVNKLKNSWDKQNLAWNAFSIVPFVGNIAAPIHAAEHSKKLEAALKKQVKEVFPEIVKKLVNEATADLNQLTTQAINKVGALITARSQEVENAQRAILQMEKVISEIKEQYQTLENQKNEEIEGLKNSSEEEISKLQGAIKELTGELKKLEEKETKYENWLKGKSARSMKKQSEAAAPKAGIIDKDTEIAKLKETIEDLKMEAAFFEDSRDQERLKLKNEKEMREISETNLKNQLERETTRLKNIISDKGAEIERVKTAWQEVYNLEKEHKENAQAEIKKLQTERANKVEREASLEAKNKNLKIDKNTLENKVRELEEKIKGLQPSFAYQMAEKFGIIKLKNIAVNTAVIVGLIAIIYIASLVLKYIAKPAWLNLAGFFPKSKKRKVIAVEAEEEEEEEEEIFEVEPKKTAKNFSRLNSQKKTAKSKGKSKSKTK